MWLGGWGPPVISLGLKKLSRPYLQIAPLLPSSPPPTASNPPLAMSHTSRPSLPPATATLLAPTRRPPPAVLLAPTCRSPPAALLAPPRRLRPCSSPLLVASGRKLVPSRRQPRAHASLSRLSAAGRAARASPPCSSPPVVLPSLDPGAAAAPLRRSPLQPLVHVLPIPQRAIAPVVGERKRGDEGNG
jgi:hypothetical protein